MVLSVAILTSLPITKNKVEISLKEKGRISPYQLIVVEILNVGKLGLQENSI